MAVLETPTQPYDIWMGNWPKRRILCEKREKGIFSTAKKIRGHESIFEKPVIENEQLSTPRQHFVDCKHLNLGYL